MSPIDETLGLVLQRIMSAMSNHPKVRALYLFGSRVCGRSEAAGVVAHQGHLEP